MLLNTADVMLGHGRAERLRAVITTPPSDIKTRCWGVVLLVVVGDGRAEQAEGSPAAPVGDAPRARMNIRNQSALRPTLGHTGK
jgi:hypothetical protein